MATDVYLNPTTFNEAVETNQFFSDFVGRIWNARGNLGETVYIGNADTGELRTRKSLITTQIVSNDFELDQLTNNQRITNFAVAFDSWNRAGNNENNWGLENVNLRGAGVVTPTITFDAQGQAFIHSTELLYTNYIHEVRLFSLDNDNDYLFVILAERNGNLLFASRASNNGAVGAGSPTTWSVVWQTPAEVGGFIRTIVEDRTASVINYATKNWNDFTNNNTSSGGVKVRVTRNENIITCETTNFSINGVSQVNAALDAIGPWDYVAAATMVINLTTIADGIFADVGSGIGYGASSQGGPGVPNYYEVLQFADTSPAYNANTGEKITVTPAGNWVIDPADTLVTDFVPGTTLYDQFTKKSFVVLDSNRARRVSDTGHSSNVANAVVCRDSTGAADFSSVVLVSPNGTRYRLLVDDTGNVPAVLPLA